MTKRNYIFSVTLGLCCLLGTTGCQDWLDINVSPNNPTEVPLTQVFVSGQVTGAYELYAQVNTTASLWAQHWASTGAQYRQRDQYEVASNTFTNQWVAFYADVLSDLQYAIDQGTELGTGNFVAPARILRTYYFLVITEMWGSVPYTQALSGADEVQPTYDSQADIYTGLLDELDQALGEIDLSDEAVTYQGTQDFMYAGNMERWRKFANTLKLKIYMRLTNADPTLAEEGVRGIFATNAELIASIGEDGEVPFFDAVQNRNPQWEQHTDRPTDLGPSSTLLTLMRDLNDPRITQYFDVAINYDPTVGGDSIVGELNGQESNALLPNTGDYSRIGERYRAATKSSPLLTYFERLFLEAEAVIRGWHTGDAAALYQQAIIASMEKAGLTEADALAYFADGEPAAFPSAGNTDEQLQALYTQKYIALYSMGLEAFTEWRRTGVPAFDAALNSDLAGQVIARFPYSDDELTKNSNTPPITLTEKLYFAK